MPLFQVSLCETGEIVIVEGDTNLVNPPFFWSFSSETGVQVCGEVDFEVEGGIPVYTAATQYESCLECYENILPPLSANTLYEVCVSCSGSTFTVGVDHPVWTGLYGETITQLDGVQLGGRNGLYS